MGRESSFTDQELFDVANALIAEGVKPTSREVRGRLGTGSMGSILKGLQRWKASRAQSAATMTLPPAIQEAVFDFLNRELATTKTHLESEFAGQQTEMTVLIAENDRQAAEIVLLNQRIEARQADEARLQGRASALEAELAIARKAAERSRDAAEAVRTELAKVLIRLEAMPRLVSDLSSAQVALTAERQVRTELEQRVAVLEAQKLGLEARLAEARC